MAGIGFELRKLTNRDDLLGVVVGYGHSALTSTGPWLFTILSLSGIVMLSSERIQPEDLFAFRIIVIYNFAFSLVSTGPMVLVVTRRLADSIYAKDVSDAPAMLLGAMFWTGVIQALFVIPFYLLYVDADAATRFAAIANYFAVSWIWLVTAFLTALKDYKKISWAFAVGMAGAMVLAVVLGERFSIAGTLVGFTIGMAWILFSLLARVLAEYPYTVRKSFRFASYFRTYRHLAWSGLIYNAAIWTDKWIMWFAPQAETGPLGLVSHPDYDTAMFMAYLTIVPSMAAFLMIVETRFFESYLRFYREVQNHGTLTRINRNQSDLIGSVLSGGRTLIVVQATVAVATILAAPYLIEPAGMRFQQIGIFRIGVLGAFFHVLFLSISVVMSYFDMRRETVFLHTVFLVSNGVLTFTTLKAGFPYYGYGYFGASVIAFTVGFVIVGRFLNQLPYHAFVTNNQSVTAVPVSPVR